MFFDTDARRELQVPSGGQPTSGSSSGSGLSKDAIIGIVFGVVTSVIGIIGLPCCVHCYRNRV